MMSYYQSLLLCDISVHKNTWNGFQYTGEVKYRTFILIKTTGLLELQRCVDKCLFSSVYLQADVASSLVKALKIYCASYAASHIDSILW